MSQARSRYSFVPGSLTLGRDYNLLQWAPAKEGSTEEGRTGTRDG
jgi:hypothetical protein